MSNFSQPRAAQLSAAKQALLAQRLQGKIPANRGEQSIPRRSPNNPARLSFAQQRLWFLHQLEPESVAYNLPRAIRLMGDLDIEALAQSFSEIVRRHEVLRTTFRTVRGEPIPAIAPAAPIHLPITDLQTLAEEASRRAVQDLTAQEARRPFDLAQGPLLRLQLLKLSTSEHVLLLTLHHIVSDAWSTGVLVREMVALYDAFTKAEPSPLPELSIQYADFADWQRQQQVPRKTQLAYWQQQLAGELTILQLPSDRPRTALQTHQGAKRSCSLSPALTHALKQLSQFAGTTLFMTLLAAFNVLLHRYTQQIDIVVGTPIANRNRAELEGAIGFFINTLVLRSDLSGDPSFRALLGRVREVALGAYAHQDLPFEVLVEALQPERNLSRNPLFQVMFALHNVPMAPLELADLTLESLKSETGTAQVDLSLDLVETPEGLLAELEYSTDLFEAETIARMLGHFQVLLTGIIANPDQKLSQLPLLTPEEQHQILTQWNSPSLEDPCNLCIHELFEAQVARSPQAIAIAFAGQQLTYAELNTRANRLAHYLRSRGVQPDQLVGLCVGRSLEMAVGVLGILKAGGAYVPLDPAYPPERLAFILGDARIDLLLTQSNLLANLSAHQAEVICLDGELAQEPDVTEDLLHEYCICPHPPAPSPNLGRRGARFKVPLPGLGEGFRERAIIYAKGLENPPRAAAPDRLAYVIYTSGSTGTPKGVLITHQALVSHSQTAADLYQLQESDRVLQFASLSFDVAAEELFPTWLRGATVLLREEETLGLDRFHTFLTEAQLTVLNLPTAYWHEWVSYLIERQLPLPPALRLVIVGTEPASPEKLKLWQSFADNSVRWLNAYGPTEATISATVYEAPSPLTEGQVEKVQSHYTRPLNPPNLGDFRVQSPPKLGGWGANAGMNGTSQTAFEPLMSVPIGRPLPQVQVYLLDPALNLTPIGVLGELCIAGRSLARGYLNHPDLTIEKFIPNPFGTAAGDRLYKTGDFARYLPDGNIELIGRIDRQVKIRGFRIELAEIEARLAQCPVVREAVVVAQELTEGDRTLVAYIVPENRSLPSDRADLLLVQTLRDHLSQILPSYMIPSHFVALEVLPLLPNGKVDRRSLSLPVERKSQPTILPQTELEQAIATLWQQALNLDSIGLHDNFFDMGGHSLLMVRVQSQLIERFGQNLSLLDLFRYPTIHSLAQHLGQTPPEPDSDREIEVYQKRESGKAHQRKRLKKMKSMGSMTGGQSA
ncbi:condensation domain-containing protein [Altericista sp. CCNU0014]|uniref:non-ribosomal peptide synthetase n=1 Tax=Altericista sp. CCNU0014 TaxID=3082949 RepID=UPI00384E35DE